jgi:hypothetical protein
VVVAVAAAKRKKSKPSANQWGFKLAGIVLCAFFALGVITGLSRAGRILALRLETILNLLPGPGHSSVIPTIFLGGRVIEPTIHLSAQRPTISLGSAVALVHRANGFYELDSDGTLRGPLAPATQGDMPILSGTGALAASPAQLMDYAAALVRAEAGLGAVVSEMRIGAGRTATIFLEHPRIEVVFDIDRTAFELLRAVTVLRMWRGHEALIASLDLTTSGQAVMRMKSAAFASDHHAPGTQMVALTVRPHLPHSQPEGSTHP